MVERPQRQQQREAVERTTEILHLFKVRSRPDGPLLSEPGSSNPLTNPDSSSYYVWDGQTTTAQYYVNKAGYGLADSCLWNSPIDADGAGNFSPMNIGVGRNAEGLTYLSIFRNLPSSQALLDFNIEITGPGLSSKCSYIDGVFTGGTSTGCTVSVVVSCVKSATQSNHQSIRWLTPRAGRHAKGR